MDKKQLSGEYLAPELEVVEMKLFQAVLTVSNVNNPFEGGEEENW